jgi:8-oxo-dGTP diphosphatase
LAACYGKIAAMDRPPPGQNGAAGLYIFGLCARGTHLSDQRSRCVMHYLDYDTRLAAYAVVARDGHILLSLWNEVVPGRWTMPGGGVEYHETVEAAVVREVREETGYDVSLVRLLGVDTLLVPASDRTFATERPLKSVRVVFEATVTGGELTPEVNGSTDEARWVPLADVPALPRVALVDVALALWQTRRP